MKNITFRQLRVFEAVARNLSFSRAAEQMFLTQPAVSMQVKQLEEMVGLPLTGQIGKKIHLTEAGEEMAHQARLILRQLREAEESIAQLKGLQSGRLTLGLVSSAKYFAPRLLVGFRKIYPQAELHLSVSNREAIIKQLIDGDIDLAIMGRPPAQVETTSHIFADNPLVFVAAADNQLVKENSISPSRLGQELFLTRESGSGTRLAMEEFFYDADIQPPASVEMSSSETIKQAVMAGMGIAFISRQAILLEMAAGLLTCLNVRNTPVMRKWYIVSLAEKKLLPMPVAFRNFLLETGSALLASQPLVD